MNDINYDELVARVLARQGQDRLESDGWKHKDQRTYGLGAITKMLQPGDAFERREPIVHATVTAQVLVPIYRSVCCGIAGGVIVGLGVGLEAGVVAGALIASGSFFHWLRVGEKALWVVEKLTRTDLDGDGVVGEPQRYVRVENVQTNGKQQRILYGDIPATDEQLTYLATALFIQRQPFSREKLSGKGKPISDPAFRKLQKSMREAELIWPTGSGHNAGFKLNGAGRQFLTQFLQKE